MFFKIGVLFYRKSPLTTSVDFLFYITISKRCCRIYCSYTLHNCFILKPKITFIRFHLLIFFVPSLLFVAIVSRCHSLYHSLSLVVLLVVTRCHSLYHSLPFVVTRCTTRLCLFINDCFSHDIPLLINLFICLIQLENIH